MTTARRATAALLGALISLATLGLAPAANADELSVPKLLGVQLSQSAVTVSGLAVTDVVVRLHLASYKGIVPSYSPECDFADPNADFVRTTDGRGQVAVAPPTGQYVLVSGNAEDGWWEQTVHVTAGYDGTFAVTHVYATQADGVALSIDPRTIGINAQLQVTGVDIPHLTITQTPDPATTGHDLTLSGTVTSLDTGKPFAGVEVNIGFDTELREGGGMSVTTGVDGEWRHTWSKWQFGGSYSEAFVSAPVAAGSNEFAEYVGFHAVDPHFREWVTARMAASSVRAGGKDEVTGVSSASGMAVSLQRLAGRTWRTVGTATVRYDGHFTLTAQPPTRGIHHYRVLRPATRHNEVGASSAQLVLVAR